MRGAVMCAAEEVRVQEREDRWWLTGEEQCEACEQHYAYDVEVRCVDCDAALCPLCAQWQAREGRCADCAASRGA
jgi:hypothetical protein